MMVSVGIVMMMMSGYDGDVVIDGDGVDDVDRHGDENEW